MNYLEEAKDIRDELRFQGNSWNRQRIIQKAQKLKLKIISQLPEFHPLPETFEFLRNQAAIRILVDEVLK